MTPFEIVALIGAVTGSISLAVVIIQALMNKPKLTFDEERKNFHPNERGSNVTTIIIGMKVHNKGTKPTTIHHTRLSFDYNSEHHELENNTSHTVPPNSTVDYSPHMYLHKDDGEIYGQITNCVLTVTHTHGENTYNLGTIEEYKRQSSI